MIRILLSLLFSINLPSGISCNDIPSHFSSYYEASRTIKSATFEFTDEADTYSSSWIRGASYYSCDGAYGYFLLLTDSKEYIHQNVPIEVWYEFKDADSFGSYYDDNIRKQYRFVP